MSRVTRKSKAEIVVVTWDSFEKANDGKRLLGQWRRHNIMLLLLLM